MKRQLDTPSVVVEQEAGFLGLPIEVWQDGILGERNFPDFRPLLCVATVSRRWQWLVYGQAYGIILGDEPVSKWPPDNPTYLGQLRNLDALRSWGSIVRRQSERLVAVTSGLAPQLKILSLMHTDDYDYDVLARMALLERLDIIQHEKTVLPCEKLSILATTAPALRMLNLIDCPTLGLGLRSTLPLSLTTLSLVHCSRDVVSEQEMIARLTNLTTLSFMPHPQFMPLSGLDYRFLSSLTGLQRLMLNRNDDMAFFSTQCRANVAHYVPRMTTLRHLGIAKLDLLFRAETLATMTQLTSLDISGRYTRGDVDAVRGLMNLTELECQSHTSGGLDFEGVKQLRKEGALPLLRRVDGISCQ